MFSQILLWLFSIDADIFAGAEVMIVTLVVSLFIALYFAGYRWTRWVAGIALGLLAPIIASMTVEGFGYGFLVVAILYAVIIAMLFIHRGQSKAAQTTDVNSHGLRMKEPVSPPRRPVADGFYVGEEVYRYPLLLKRYQSLLIDAILFFAIMVMTMVMMGESEARQTVMISLAAIFSFLYEPLLTSYSATVGQHLMGIRVRDVNNPKERINVFQAYVRFLVKWFFGWLSFVTINFNPEHRAIHDLAGSSVVISNVVGAIGIPFVNHSLVKALLSGALLSPHI